MTSVDNIRTWLGKRHINAPREWIGLCSAKLRRQNIIVNQDRIYDEWLRSDLNIVKSPSLPVDLNLTSSHQRILNGNFVLQINSILDISRPYYSQYQIMCGSDTSNTEVSAEVPRVETWQPKPTRMLQLKLTDGIFNIKGMEYKPIPCLHAGLPPGTKIHISGEIQFRRGTLLLKNSNVKVLGGEVKELASDNSTRNLLVGKLGIADQIAQTTGQDNDQQVQAADEFPDDDADFAAAIQNHYYEELETQQQNINDETVETTRQSVENSSRRHYNSSRNSRSNQSAVTVQDYETTNEYADSSGTEFLRRTSGSSRTNSFDVDNDNQVSMDDVNRTTNLTTASSSVGFNWPGSSDEKSGKKYPLFSSRSPEKALFGPTSSTSAGTFSNKTKSKLRLHNLSRLSTKSASASSSSEYTRQSDPLLNKPSCSSTNYRKPGEKDSVANDEDMWNEYSVDLFSELMDDDDFVKLATNVSDSINLNDKLEKEDSKLSSSKSKLKHKSTSNSVTKKSTKTAQRGNASQKQESTVLQHSASTSPKLPITATSELTHIPFTYIQEIVTKYCQKPMKYTVRGFIISLLSNVKSNSSNGWVLDALINDGTGSLKVEISNKVLEELLGYSHEVKAEAKKNPEIHKALLEGVENCCKILHDFSGLMDIEIIPGEVPQLMKLSPITEAYYEQLLGVVCELLH